jgi:asparagine synthase (glutamine-hydrolysing)
MSQGIFGVIDFNQRIDDPGQLAAGMGRFLEQGGRDSVSYASGDHFLLGMKRVGREPEQQVKIAEDSAGRLFCLMHGEFHNFGDLVKAESIEGPEGQKDLDLLLHLYRKYGPDFAKKLNGLFCIGILDQEKRTFYLLNDRFGMAHQVYWTVINGRLVFATHLKTLLGYPGITREVDREGLNLFLKYSYVPSPWSIFKGINKLPPGHRLMFKNGNASTVEYWDFSENGTRSMVLEEAVEQYKGALRKSIERRLGSNAGVGILLSGGLDSSANVALARECTGKSLKTFSIGFENEAFDERPYARIVAKRFGTEHFEYIITGDEIEDLPRLVWHLEEPYFEFGLFLTYLGMKAARKEAGVVLGGEGADQLFGTGGFVKGLPVALRYLLQKSHLIGTASFIAKSMRGGYFYDRDNLAFKIRLLMKRVVDLNNWYFYGYDEHELGRLYRYSSLAKVPRIFSDSSSNMSASFEDLYCKTALNQDVRHYANENVMVKSGRMADMLGLTLREAYLDADVADFLVSLEYSLKRKGGVVDHLKGNIKTKYLHRKAMETVLPEDIMTKPKQGGFVPVMIFLKEAYLRKRIYSRLLESDTMKQYFDMKHLARLFSDYEKSHGKEIYWYNFNNSKANRILFLLTFDIWHSYYMGNSCSTTPAKNVTSYLDR